MTDPALPTVIFIRSMGHSGSTLLDLLISSHPDVVSVGEVVRFNTDSNTRCTCGTASVFECPFWQQVDAVLTRDHDLTLRTLQLRTDDDATFVRHNRALFQAVSQVSGAAYIVDSSKHVDRLQSFLRTDAVAIKPVHLVRGPRGIANSNLKRDRRLMPALRSYMRGLMKSRRLLKDRDHHVVRYERLVANPAATLSSLMAWIGVEYDPDQLNWAGRERHNFGGNLMRFSTDSAIRLDTGWKKGLRWSQKMVVSLVTWPAALPGTAVWELWRCVYDPEGWHYLGLRFRSLGGRLLGLVGLRRKTPR